MSNIRSTKCQTLRIDLHLTLNRQYNIFSTLRLVVSMISIESVTGNAKEAKLVVSTLLYKILAKLLCENCKNNKMCQTLLSDIKLHRFFLAARYNNFANSDSNATHCFYFLEHETIVFIQNGGHSKHQDRRKSNL